jgi:hypothetical protein
LPATATGAASEPTAEDLLWHAAGRNQLAGEHRGREAVYGFFGKFMQVTEGSFHLDLHTVLADDEHGVALAVARPAGAVGAWRSTKRTSFICTTARWWNSGTPPPLLALISFGSTTGT